MRVHLLAFWALLLVACSGSGSGQKTTTTTTTATTTTTSTVTATETTTLTIPVTETTTATTTTTGSATTTTTQTATATQTATTTQTTTATKTATTTTTTTATVTSPPTDVDAVLAPYLGMCAARAKELKAALCPSGGATCDPGCTYYLAADGSDTADGKAGAASGTSGPWKTLDRLKNVDLADGQSVCFRRGDVFRGGIILPYGKQHATPIAFQSYGDPSLPKPALSGSVLLPSAWTPTAESPSIFQIDLEGTLWKGTAYTRNGKTYTPHDRIYQLFVDGQGMTLARFPNIGAGDSTVQGVELPAGNYSLIDSFSASNRIVDSVLPATSPLVSPTNFAGASLFYKEIRWMIMRTEVASHDSAAHALTTKGAIKCSSEGDSCQGWGYLLVDSLSALDAPGEWYFDVDKKRLYFWPPSGVVLATATVEASVYKEDMAPPSWASASTPPELQPTTGLDLNRSSGIRVRDLTFRHYSKNGIWNICDLDPSSADDPRCVKDIWIDGCDFIDTGAAGVALTRWNAPLEVDTGDRISLCKFRNQASQAVFLQVRGGELSCSDIADIGRLENYSRFGMTLAEVTVHDQGHAVMGDMADRAKFLFNRFERTAAAGLSFLSSNQLVAFNFFRHACYTKSDCGAVHTYTWGDDKKFDVPSVNGSLLAHNIVLETKGATEGGRASDGWIAPLGNGFFLDMGAQSYTVKRNVSAGHTNCGLMQQVNRKFVTEENLLYDNTRFNEEGYLLGGLCIISDMDSDGIVRNNAMLAVDRMQTTLSIREANLPRVATFSGNMYFDPFAWDSRTADTRWDGYNIYQIDDSNTVSKFSLEGWRSVDATAHGAPMSWVSQQVATSGPNLVGSSDFSGGLAGWHTESWAAAKVVVESHPDLGPALKYTRNGAQGGRIGVISNTFAVEAGRTYMVRFWIAPDPGSAKKEPFTLLLGNSDWIWVPNDKVRQVTFFVTAKAAQAGADLELTPYPDYADQFWIDDVEVREVTTAPFRNSAIVRYDEPLPADARSILVYNDTESNVVITLPAGGFVKPDGTALGTSLTVSAFWAEVLIPVAHAQDPVKVK